MRKHLNAKIFLPDPVHVVHEHVRSLPQRRILLPEGKESDGGDAGQDPRLLLQVLSPKSPLTPGEQRALPGGVTSPGRSAALTAEREAAGGAGDVEGAGVHRGKALHTHRRVAELRSGGGGSFLQDSLQGGNVPQSHHVPS